MHRCLAVMTIVVACVLTARPAAAQVSTPSPPATSPGGATPLAQTDIASYGLTARWDPATNQIHGSATISYRNQSSDTLGEVWLRLYLNAFRDESTPWMQESGGAHRANGYDPRHPGWIRLESLRLAGTGEDVLPSDGASGSTVLRVPLPAGRAVRSGEQVGLEVTWTSQMPRVFARTGFAGDFVMAGQWYPKLAVYDRGRWDSEPWHANSEFFADVGDYTLDLTVPADYVTGASGMREGTVVHPDGTATTRYRAASVTDVAWTAWPGYRQVTRAVMAAGQAVELELLAPRTLPTTHDERYVRAASVALDQYGRWFGAYPWPKLTMVVPPDDAIGAGGMEYPSLVTLDLPTELPFGLGSGIHDVEVVTVHEIAHQWAPMQANTDEGREAWLDEGFADYATTRVLRTMFDDPATMLDLGPFRLSYEMLHRLQYVLIAVRQPLDQPSWQYSSEVTYGATVYSKGSLALETLERHVGPDRFLPAMRGYFDRWRWRHPTARDLQASLEAGTGESLGWFFDPFVFGTGVVEYAAMLTADGRGTVIRRGDAAFPVDLDLYYADGRVEREQWPGDAEHIDLDPHDGPLFRVDVDPDRVIRIEPDSFDDGVDRFPPRLPLMVFAARVLAVLQTTLLAAGTLG